MEIDLSSLTISAALASLRQGDFTALSLTEACLRLIDRINPELNAFITLTPELAVQSALQADSLLSLKPSNIKDLALLGIPLALKDLYETAGVLTTAGTKFFSGN